MNITNIALTPLALSGANAAVVRRVSERLPELESKIKYFDRQNSQHTLALMSLTMLNGQSPYRLLRQVMAEVERRKMALAEAQLEHAKKLSKLKKLQASDTDDPVVQAKIRLEAILLDSLESKINGALKDIATLVDAYDNIRAQHNIDQWDESDFEAEEKRHHVRRAFELLYRNMVNTGRAGDAAIEYLHQYGVHVQIAIKEVAGYIQNTERRIASGERPTSTDVEDFLDEMGDKYKSCADVIAERLFGKSDFASQEYMMRNVSAP